MSMQMQRKHEVQGAIIAPCFPRCGTDIGLPSASVATGLLPLETDPGREGPAPSPFF
jgi:hypothetical protein